MVFELKKKQDNLAQFFITPFEGKIPQFDGTVFIDPTVRLIGEVILKSEVGIWPLTVLRADSNPIIVGERTMILDKVLMESPKEHPVVIGKRALISHGATLHGCTIQEGAIVGIGAIVLDGAEVGRHAIVGAGSLVPPGMKVPEDSLVLGVPGKIVRKLTDSDLKRLEEQWAEAYEKSRRYLKIFKK